MKIIILLLLTFFAFSNLEAQHIYLHKKEPIFTEKPKTIWVKRIRNKQHVSIKTKSGKRFMGRIFLVNDSTVAIHRKLISLREITSITKRPLVQYIYSIAGMALGSVMIYQGLSAENEAGGMIFTLGYIELMGGVMTGIIPHMRHYSKNWTYKIEMNK